jgi:hypothetical protein
LGAISKKKKWFMWRPQKFADWLFLRKSFQWMPHNTWRRIHQVNALDATIFPPAYPITVLWDVTSCSLVKLSQFRKKRGGSNFLRNLYIYLLKYTASYHKEQWSEYLTATRTSNCISYTAVGHVLLFLCSLLLFSVHIEVSHNSEVCQNNIFSIGP